MMVAFCVLFLQLLAVLVLQLLLQPLQLLRFYDLHLGIETILRAVNAQLLCFYALMLVCF